jgi:hypothetical protein
MLRGEFVALYFDENRSLSGNRILRLYSRDSVFIEELLYGAHPMEIISHSDSSITIEVGVCSGHGDLAYRTWYLDHFTSSNPKIGQYRIHYIKDYDLKHE